MKQCAFAVVAHPDDIEFMMAGTLILLRDAGYEIHYMTVADGACGSIQYDGTTTAALRRQEAMAAAALVVRSIMRASALTWASSTTDRRCNGWQQSCARWRPPSC